MCYGQTGSGKTHTMFGPPGLMAQAGSGAFGENLHAEYGLCPRGLLDIMGKLEVLRQQTKLIYELTASAVELTMTEGNLDMFRKAVEQKKPMEGFKYWSTFSGSLDKTTKPPILLGQEEIVIDSLDSMLSLFGAISSRNQASTGLNDSSSRSHCAVYLCLYVYNPQKKTLRKSRFQFVDLAGSERL